MANLIYDTFIIKEKYHANSEDSNNLIKLYMPIMGMDAYSLYNVFITLDEGEEYTYKNVLDLLVKFTITSLNEALDKLEAFGLVKTYYNKEKGYLHEVFPPLSKNDFLGNELLKELLVGAIGEDAVKKLSSKKEYRGYKEVTKKFTDVFTISTTNTEKALYNIIKNDIDVENRDFNYPLFKGLCEDILPENVLTESGFEKHIMRLAFTYKLTPEDMKDCIVKSMQIDQNLEYPTLAKYAKTIFNTKYEVSAPKAVSKNVDKYIGSVNDDEWADILASVESMSFTDVLASLSGIKPAISEVRMLERLQEETGYSTGVINLMVLIVNKEKDGELPQYNYFEKIAQTWKRANINNAYDVLKYYNDKKKVKSTSSTKYIKKEVPTPSWYGDYKKSLDERKEKSDFSDEQKSDALNFIKEFFNDGSN